jgi:hypothetical protein
MALVNIMTGSWIVGYDRLGQTGPGAHPAPVQWVPGLIPPDKKAGDWR